MAYAAFQELGGTAAAWRGDGAGPSHGAAAAPRDQLTALEWSVVAIARKDSRASLREPGRFSTALRALFKQPNPKLADERLEALRRVAVLTWRDGYTIPSRELRSFLAAGFTAVQYEAMVDGIGAAKSRRPARLRALGVTA